jgi:hypothetical protein
MSIVLWGPSGCGKTTFAATAPGEKLLLMWDDNGGASLSHRNDCHIVPLYKEAQSSVEMFKTPDPMGLDKFLKENQQIETVIFDSMTSFAERALYHGVVKAQGTAKGKGATIEDPGYAGYGNKNTWTHLAVSNLLAVTAKHNRHMIFIAHEGSPDKDAQGNVITISLLLGSTLSKEVPIKISEVWAMQDTEKGRRIAIRPCRMRSPMKTRMFDTSGEPEFMLKYDYEKANPIAEWYSAWKANGFRKLKLPA